MVFIRSLYIVISFSWRSQFYYEKCFIEGIVIYLFIFSEQTGITERRKHLIDSVLYFRRLLIKPHTNKFFKEKQCLFTTIIFKKGKFDKIFLTTIFMVSKCCLTFLLFIEGKHFLEKVLCLLQLFISYRLN